MTQVRRIADVRAAQDLAALLNGAARTRPVVVVTIPAGRDNPWIDAEQIAEQVGALAEVYLMPTGEPTWAFADAMAPGTQVYGGAGRVYPVGNEWTADIRMSPLRFAFGASDADLSTQQLISDALRMAAAAGLVRARTPAAHPATGVVEATIASRAIVDIGNSRMAVIAAELVAEDVAIDRLVTKGQRVTGSYDPASRRLDVTASLRPATEALAEYSVGDVVLARVAALRAGRAELVLYPKTTEPAVTVTALRADVTGNPLDDLRTLMTVGEVIAARITATAPAWALVLNDIDDDEPLTPAPALLPGGPPWLTEQDTADLYTVEEPPEPAPPALPLPAAVSTPAVVEPVPAPKPVHPTPALLDKNRDKRPTAAPGITPAPKTESAQYLRQEIAKLTAQVASLEAAKARLDGQLLDVRHEQDQMLRYQNELVRRADRAEHNLTTTRAKLRKATTRAAAPDAAAPVFADREQGFRYLVLGRWAVRTPPAEQPANPLPGYRIGPNFLDSLDTLEGVSPTKVADVVVEIVTGRAPSIAAREVHRLRTGAGASDPPRTRGEDGALAWRASLQVKTPAARRIHYWQLADGTYELARVATHDDFAA